MRSALAGSTGAAVTGIAVASSDSTQFVNSPTSYTVPAYSDVFMISPAKMKVCYVLNSPPSFETLMSFGMSITIRTL